MRAIGLSLATFFVAFCLFVPPAKGQTSAWAWGGNYYGQLGDGANMDLSVPTLTSGLVGVKSVSAGRYHSLALKTDGTVWAWGGNYYGQLGDGANADRNVPVPVPGLTDVAAVSAGGTHSLALKTDGTVWAWGGNYYGQLGDGTAKNHNTPVPVPGLTDVAAISAGGAHSLAVKTDGTVWSWGYNGTGQLGDGTITNHSVPALVPSLAGVAAVSAGGRWGYNAGFSLAVKTDGTVWAWGYNFYGELGDGTHVDRSVPVPVPALTNVASVSAGSYHSLAMKTDGTAWAWGYNYHGQLGDGTTTDRRVPTQVAALTNVASLDAGDSHSLALKGNGSAWAWGSNANGELGDGTVVDHASPVGITGLTNVASVSAGRAHSLAVVPPVLVFAPQPQAGAAGAPLTPQPIVEARNPDGTVMAAVTGQIVISIKPGTGDADAVLSGTTTMSMTSGVATFTDLSIDRPGKGYVLTATFDGTAAIQTLPFDVYSTPAHLVFSTQPDRAEATQPFGQEPVVLVRDANDLLLSDFNGQVSLVIKAATGAVDATLGGTTAVIAVNGVATFADVSIDKKGAGYVLEAFAGPDKLGESAAFTVAPKAEALAFTIQPAGATNDWPFTTQPTVTVQDAEGATAALYNGPVSIAIKADTGTAGAALSGIGTVNALHGVAALNGLAIRELGTGYVLTASAPGLTSGDSAAFDVTEAPALVMRQSTADEVEISLRPAGQTVAAATIVLTYSAEDLKTVQASDVTLAAGWSQEWRDTAAGLTLSLSNAGGASTDARVATVRLIARPGLSGRSTPVTLTEGSSLVGDSGTTIPVAPSTVGFVPGGHIAFTKQPFSTTAGRAIAGPPTVAVKDGTDAVVSDYAQPVTMSIKVGTGAADAMLGGATEVNATAGLAAFRNLIIDRKGTGYVLVASAGAFTTDSVAFDITPVAINLVFATQPGGARAGLALDPQPIVMVQDDGGATVLTFSGLVTLGIKQGTGFPSAVLAGANTVRAVGGVATFTDVRIDAAAPGYVLVASAPSLTGAQSAAFDISPFAYTPADVADSLRWAGGLGEFPRGFQSRFDVVTNGTVDLADVVAIARKAVGLDANP